MQNSIYSSGSSALPDKYFKTWMTIQRARHAIYLVREKELEPYGVSPEQASILHAVGVLGNNATPAEIARWIYRKPHTVSIIINRMLSRGLLKKSRDLPNKNLENRFILAPLNESPFSG